MSDSNSLQRQHIPQWEFEMITDVAQRWDIEPTEAENFLSAVGQLSQALPMSDEQHTNRDGGTQSDSTQSTRGKYSRTGLIEHIQRLANGDDPPTVTEFNADDDAPSTGAVQNSFQSWNNAIQAAGLTPRTHGKSTQYSRHDIIEHIQRLATDDDPPTQQEFNDDDDAPSLSTVLTRFESWGNAVEVAGFDPHEAGRNPQYSTDELITHIQRLATGDDPPTQQEFDDDNDAPSTGAVQNYFQSWNDAIQAAGLTPRTHGGSKQYSRHDIIRHIQRLATGDDPPTQSEFNAADDAPSATTVQNSFASWNDAVEAAGFKPRVSPPQKYSRTELLTWLIDYRREFGVWPAVSDLADWSGPSKAPFRREFGTFTHALTIATEKIDNE